MDEIDTSCFVLVNHDPYVTYVVALLPWFNNSVHRLRTTVFAQCSGGNCDDDDDGYGYGGVIVVVVVVMMLLVTT